MAESLYEIFIDDNKRQAYCENVIREGLKDEYFIETATFNLAVDGLDCMLKIRGNPFYYHWDLVDTHIQSTIEWYIDTVQSMNEIVYGKKILRVKDILGEEQYEKEKHLYPEPSLPSSDYCNDNLRVCFLPY